jgi:hypothetical protein
VPNPRDRGACIPCVAALLITACGMGAPKADSTRSVGANPPSETCTAMGCRNQFIIEVIPRPLSAFRVVVSDSAGTVQSMQCESVTACMSASAGDTARIPLEKTVGPVSIRVTDAAKRSVTLQLVPKYEGRYLNGPRCGETCRVARARVDWPH